MFDSWRGFAESALSTGWQQKLAEKARIARGEIIKMTTIAASGHPGGSMSSLEMYLLLYHFAKVDPGQPYRDDRDRVIISHGHTSPGAYTALASAGFFDIAPALWGFRLAGSPFEGHVERSVPGIEWDTGNLGQGLSVGCGKALYARLSGQKFHTYVVMGDGEQQKGQIAEARRFAFKYRLTNLTALVDFNRLQISGKLSDVMPQQVKAGWGSDGWRVIEVDGHDWESLYAAMREATRAQDAPVMILAHTVMGKGVSFMENDETYHGAALSVEQARKAFIELGGMADDLDALAARRKSGPPPAFATQHAAYPKIDPGVSANYGVDEKLDNRGAFGKALVSVAEANMGKPGIVMAVFDCDLAKSVKVDGFAKKYPQSFFQCGISEHSTATMAGALSAETAVSVWADFGVFGIDETYNQARLNDINHSNLKLFCTHSGVMVGEDGKTHQCIDYFALLNSTFGWKVITPADPNQTDRVVRYVLSTPGNFAVIMGRSVVPMITNDSGEPYFGGTYRYQYGRMEWLRRGEQVALVAAGNIVPTALQAWNTLCAEGVRISLVCVSDWSDMHAEDLSLLARYQDVVVLEDHNVKTGLGTALGSAMFEGGHRTRLTRMGVTRYAASGKPDDLYKLLGIDAGSVAAKVRSLLIEKSVTR